MGIRLSRKEQYPWVVPMEQDDGTVTGLLCELCIQLNATKQLELGAWATTPCTSLRRIEHHRHSIMHMVAVQQQQEHAGICANLLESQRMAALVGALEIVYWLAKEDIAICT